jgi:hypothetical protein
MNEELLKLNNNTKLDIPITMEGIERVTVAVKKRDPAWGKKPTVVWPAYCPFCGKRYQDAWTPKSKKQNKPKNNLALRMSK